jgi:hypothetical protein
MCKCCTDHKQDRKKKLYEFLEAHTPHTHDDGTTHVHDHEHPHDHTHSHSEDTDGGKVQKSST